MASIPGGRFEMRTRKTTVDVKPFCLDVHEATVADYAECLRAGRCTQSHPNACNGPTIDFEGKDSHPIVCIDFAQAEAYCEFRHKRLPLDEEWEWAARGGRKASEFPWGSAPPDHQLCWTGPSGERRGTCPVGSFDASSWGVHDLAGNVAEWTTTRNDDHIPERSARGGSWRDRSRNAVRAARPGWFKPNYKSASLGVRCAQDPG
jgi:formylglycine-generating enzyme required for sulfatase activity